MNQVVKVDIVVESPITLSSGKADVTVDCDVIHDRYGLPYFPAKRLKGLLSESALEIAEMSELSQAGFLSKETVAELFQHGTDSPVQFIIHDFHLVGYNDMVKDLQYLQSAYPECILPDDVLREYTSLRYQTAIDDTGVAADTSLHNMRVVKAGITFTGNIELQGVEERHFKAFVLALQNLRCAGLKRNRGFGKIKCSIQEIQQGSKIIANPNMKKLVQTALARGAK